MSLIINSIDYNGKHEVPVDDMQKYTRECADRLPTCNKYDLIYADPPWDYANTVKYPLMAEQDLARMKVSQLSNPEGCILLMWSTSLAMSQAIKLMDHWGFVYKHIWLYWRKTDARGQLREGQGWWSRTTMEPLLLGVLKSKKCAPSEWVYPSCTPSQEYNAPRSIRNSEKPHGIRDLIRATFKCTNRIELFSRHCDPLFGDAWGLEINNFYWAPHMPVNTSNALVRDDSTGKISTARTFTKPSNGKRRRLEIRTCEQCRNVHKSCLSDERPCARCIKYGLDCVSRSVTSGTATSGPTR